jgi:O-antigen/teichoic acid export membrane protein
MIASAGYFWLAIRYGGAMLVNFLGGVILLRLLTPEEWGQFAVPLLLYVSSSDLATRGFATWLVREPEEWDLESLFALQHAMAVALALLLFALSPGEMDMRLSAAAAVYFLSWRAVPIALLERDLAFHRVMLVELLETVLFSVVSIAGAWAGETRLGVLAALVLRGALPSVLAFVLCPVPVSLQFRRATWRRVRGFAFANIGNSVLSVLSGSIASLVGARFTTPVHLAYVELAFRLYRQALFLTAAIPRLGLPLYGRQRLVDPDLLPITLTHLEQLTRLTGYPLALFAGWSPLWLSLLFGEAWTPASWAIVLALPGFLLASCCWGIISSAMIAAHRHRAVFGWKLAFTLLYAAATPFLGVAGSWSLANVVLFPWLLQLWFARIPPAFALRLLACWVAGGGVYELVHRGWYPAALGSSIVIGFVWFWRPEIWRKAY